MRRFEACLAETLKWEGGYSNDPHDPGGPTMAGVLQRVYDAWRAGYGLSRRDVREIETHELTAIYRDNYWALVRGDVLPPGVDLTVFDYGVNSGPGRAVRELQAVAGVVVDGHLGPVTLAAVHALEPQSVVRDLMARRRAFLRRIPHFWRFGKGWLRRCDGIEQAALASVALVDAPVHEAQHGWQPAITVPSAGLSSGGGKAADPAPGAAAASPSVQVSTGLGGVGTVQLGVDVAQTANKLQATGKTPGVLDFVLHLAERPSFWMAVVTVAGAAFLGLRHIAKKRAHGI